MPMTPLPTLDRTAATFKTDVDDFFATDLPLFVSEANALETAVDADKTAAANSASSASTSASEASASATTASAAATSAIAASNITVWVSGTTYALYDMVISPADYQSYRRKVAGAGTTDPSADSTNWEVVSTNVTADSTTSFTNKTLSGAVLNDGYTEEIYAVSGTTPALSPANGSIQTWTLTASSTPTAGTWNAGQSIVLMIDDGTDYTITWTSLSVTWKTDGGSAPTLNTTGETAISLWKVGTTIYGARVGDA